MQNKKEKKDNVKDKRKTETQQEFEVHKEKKKKMRYSIDRKKNNSIINLRGAEKVEKI